MDLPIFYLRGVCWGPILAIVSKIELLLPFYLTLVIICVPDRRWLLIWVASRIFCWFYRRNHRCNSCIHSWKDGNPLCLKFFAFALYMWLNCYSCFLWRQNIYHIHLELIICFWYCFLCTHGCSYSPILFSLEDHMLPQG